MVPLKPWPLVRGLPLPGFDEDGLLPIGDYELSLDELRHSSLVVRTVAEDGPWDMAWRRTLVDNLAAMVHQLWRVGISEVYVDGSFVEDKAHPNDVDGYFLCGREQFASGELEEALEHLSPGGLWTWNEERRTVATGDDVAHLPMWHRYRVDLWPDWGWPPDLDENGHRVGLPSLFRHSRRGSRARGIVKLRKDGGSP